MPIQALIFDCDGTLADSMPLHWRAWKQVTERHGIRFPEDRFYSLGGVPAPDILKILSREQALKIDCQAVAKEKETAFEQLIPQIQGIEPIIKIARDNLGKLPMAVASGGTQRIITDVLQNKTNVDTAAAAALKRNPDLVKGWLDGVTTTTGGNGWQAVQTALGSK